MKISRSHTYVLFSWRQQLLTASPFFKIRCRLKDSFFFLLQKKFLQMRFPFVKIATVSWNQILFSSVRIYRQIFSSIRTKIFQNAIYWSLWARHWLFNRSLLLKTGYFQNITSVVSFNAKWNYSRYLQVFFIQYQQYNFH